MDECDDDILALCVADDSVADDRFFDEWLASLQTGAAEGPDHDTPASSTSSDLDPPTKKRQRTSLRHEILHLRAKHLALTAQLQSLSAERAADPASYSVWANRAKDQATSVQLARQENARLQEMVRDQLKFISSLQRVMAKKPKLCDFASVAPWEMATLGATGRREAKEKLMRHQYDKLETEWIRHGLYEYEAGTTSVRKRYIESQDDALWVHFAECHFWSVDYQVLADIVWGMFTQQLRSQPHTDGNSTYFRYTAKVASGAIPPIDGRLFLRRYIETGRIVFVSRSILDDALFPSDPTRFLDNQCAWIIVQRTGDATARLTSHARFSPPLVPRESTVTDFTPGMYTECLLELAGHPEMPLERAIHDVLDGQHTA
ncbi:hypothetical protein SPRG_09546 [Saprolegnia parasitica CBS 223.65]|uniref:START domain-containing protein n=1 Tax=Saprolegnia parasitica (strain CBS 223.65) TaxID=695850 RepID=A0A067CDK3_SAPPC|nr:hypothetical protein SPRG_09546 [Saprolegnia parasitica CBS 223.65]KDO24902.1 hypothetical protein SPRG_09546 [Saprolegnia parasitica CBS 223.65]|eukprot:XP_012204362.1 hypothetical protein SPRG_09546 [Saprolegnia parasitica CBS 223.65]